MSQDPSITPQTVHDHLTTALADVVPKSAWGETSYFYNPGLRFVRGTYFATIKEKDGENDRASGLDRTGIWRLNIGVPKPLFLSHFSHLPTRPGKGKAIDGPWEFQTPDQLTPHPVYGWMAWVSVLNPSPATWADCQPLIAAAHAKAAATFASRVARLQRQSAV